MCGEHNARASAEDKTGQNTDKGHTPKSRTEIKIPDPAGNRTRAARLEGRDSYRPRRGDGFLQNPSHLNTTQNVIFLNVNPELMPLR